MYHNSSSDNAELNNTLSHQKYTQEKWEEIIERAEETNVNHAVKYCEPYSGHGSGTSGRKF